MPGFYVHRSNRIERLVDALAEVVSVPLGNALAGETIVVPSKGLERWLGMELARRLGVWARPDFPFPRAFIDGVLASALGEANRPSGFARAELTWAIAARLGELLPLPALAELSGYLAGDHDGTKLFALANRIGRVFDQYPVYRPDLVLAWEKGEDASWQALLFRALGAGERSHVAARAAELARRLRAGDALAALPLRVSIFGAPSLPPIYLAVLAAIAERTEVHLFVVSPSREHWAEIRSQREIARALREASASAEELSLTQGNPLLASLGLLGRDGQFLLESRVDYLESAELYVEPEGTSALATVQADVLALRHRQSGSAEAPPLALAADDRSLSFHACHGPMREVEVLRDQLLALLDRDPTLAPRDIVVMTPDVERYAPFIEAVFGVDRSDATYLPYRVADRGVRAVSEVAAAFFCVLEASSGRLGASEVLDALGHASVRARFGIAESELDTVRAWVAELSVRWGADAAHRAACAQPETHETTWRFGLDRLLLGWTMPGRGRERFGGALPFDDVEGDAALLAGRLAELVETLGSLGARLREARDVRSFAALLEEVLARTVDARGPLAAEHEALRTALSTITDAATRAGFTKDVPLSVVVAELEQTLGEASSAHGFLAGGVTFCALLPLRSIPFRVVCLLGMNDDAFPRSSHPPSFDRIAAQPRRGDRSVRDDDRYLFLEAILSARETFLVTYVGQTAKEGTVVPPSVVVSELLDILADSFFVPGDARAEALRERLVVRHPMQPFSPRYFSGDEGALFSYSRGNAEGARALGGEKLRERPLFAAPLATPEPPRTLALDDLARFFAAPQKTLLRERLGLFLGDEVVELADREPMDFTGLDRYRLGSELVLRVLADDVQPDGLALARAGGTLPLGMPGARAFDELSRNVSAFTATVRGHRELGRRPPLAVDVAVAGIRVVSTLTELYADVQLHVRYAKSKAASELRLWIYHLALLLSRGPEDPRESLLVERTKEGSDTIRHGHVDEPRAELERLVELHHRGRSEPLPFFPSASLAYAKAVSDGLPAAEARARAAKAFAPADQVGGQDGSDPHVIRVLARRDPWGPGFRLVPFGPTTEELALAVFTPMIRARGKA